MSTHRSLLGWVLAAACVPFAAAQFDPIIEHQATVRVAAYADIQSFLDAFGATYPGTSIREAIASRKIYLLNLPLDANEGAVAAALEGYVNPTPNVPDPNRPLIWGELNYAAQPGEGKTGSIYVSEAPNAAPLFVEQYASGKLGLGPAHGVTTGPRVAVAVLDTGIDATHPQLDGRVLSNGYNFVDGNSDTRDLGNGIDDDGDSLIDEMTGHGTFVAGLIRLTAPNAKLLPVRVLDSEGHGDCFHIAAGMFYAIDHGVEVVNMSLGSTYKAEAISDAVEEAKALGIVVVGAAGNLNHQEPREYPAMISGVFGVAAVDDQDQRAPFSNYHRDVFLSAPGDSVFLAGGAPDPARSVYSTLPNGGYGVWEGTSMATAFVSGGAALVRAQHPEWPAAEITHDLIEGILADSAINIDPLNPGFEGLLGVGRLDVAAAVAMGPAQPGPADLNGDGHVDSLDLQVVLDNWHRVHSSADMNADGVVNNHDLQVLLENWGD